MATIFTKIIKGHIPSYKIAEDDHCYAFLDINPNAKGHTLCVPKKEVDKLFDLNRETYSRLMAFSHKVALALEKAVPCNRVGMAVVGLEVPHAHVHLIPINHVREMTFSTKVQMTHEEMEELAALVRENIKE